MTATVAEHLDEVQRKMRAAAAQSASPAREVRLVAVSKHQPLERIEAAIAAGQRDFGENYLQAAQAVWPGLKARYPDIRLHMVGHVQSNKARDVVELFEVVHGLAGRSLAEKFAALRVQGKKLPELLIQVNTGEEPQKSGVMPGELAAFLTLCRQDLGLEIAGLMCIPPEEDEPRLHFGLLAQLAKRHGLAKLSMGMSADYEAAIRLGADYVRVGTALFGERG